MENLTATWRPVPRLRALSLAIVWRGPLMLLSAVTDDAGRRIGWRPLGGGIEFGETSAEAIVREMREEAGAVFRPTRRLGLIENIFEHHGERGHELVVVWEGVLDEPGLAASASFVIEDGPYRDHGAWLDPRALPEGQALLPRELAELL